MPSTCDGRRPTRVGSATVRCGHQSSRHQVTERNPSVTDRQPTPTRRGEVNVEAGAPQAHAVLGGRWLAACLIALALSTAACEVADDDATTDATSTVVSRIELRDETGPHVDAPDRAMAMTVDAIEIAGDDILVRLRVGNSDDGYLDMGVRGTIYGPLLVMRDDRGGVYESYAVEPAGIPGRRVADLSFRLAGPLDRDSTSFTLELATQRGPLTSPAATLPERDGIRWRVDDEPGATATSVDTGGSEPVFAEAPRLPDLIHFWLETEALPAES